MSWTDVADVIAGVCFLTGGLLALIAAIGVVRLPDLLSRMHAATKPQVMRLMLVLVGVAFRLREPAALRILGLVVLFLPTPHPVANPMVGRASFRAGTAATARP